MSLLDLQGRHVLQEQLGCRALSDLYNQISHQYASQNISGGRLIYGLYAADMAFRGANYNVAAQNIADVEDLLRQGVELVQASRGVANWNEEEENLCARLQTWVVAPTLVKEIELIRVWLVKNPAVPSDLQSGLVKRIIGIDLPPSVKTS